MHELIIFATGFKMISLIVIVILTVLMANRTRGDEELSEEGKRKAGQRHKILAIRAERAENEGLYYTALSLYEGIGEPVDAARCAYKGWRKTHEKKYLDRMKGYLNSTRAIYNATGRESDYEIMKGIRGRYREMEMESVGIPGITYESRPEKGGRKRGKRKRKTVLRPKRKSR